MDINNKSTLIKCETLRIHPISDIFDPTKNYLGLIDYLTGDIYIKQSDWIFNNIPRRRRRRQRRNYLHGKLFYFIYGYWKTQNTTFLGGGFSYLNGIWQFVSRTLNTVNDDGKLNKFEEILLQVFIGCVYINHRWIELSSDHRINSQSLSNMERNNKYINKVHPSQVDPNRKLHGILKWSNDQRYRIGYIQCIGLDRDIYIHSTAIQQPHSFSSSGKNLQFNIVEGPYGWKAENVTFIWP